MNKITGLLVPLITPMHHGKFDGQAMGKLIKSLEKYVDGYVPCLSSGEGAMMSDQLWQEVVASVRSKTVKPVIAGIKRKKIKDIVKLAGLAKKMNCNAIILPVPFNSDQKNIKFFEHVASKISMPIVIYNTETAAFKSIAAVKKINKLSNIIAIKDSSMNIGLFKQLLALKATGELRINLFQGMEHLLLESKGCDGFLVSLLNVEPKLCKSMFKSFSKKTNLKILNKFWTYNLGGEWYITLKGLLYSQGIIRSSEQINPAIKI